MTLTMYSHKIWWRRSLLPDLIPSQIHSKTRSNYAHNRNCSIFSAILLKAKCYLWATPIFARKTNYIPFSLYITHHFCIAPLFYSMVLAPEYTMHCEFSFIQLTTYWTTKSVHVFNYTLLYHILLLTNYINSNLHISYCDKCCWHTT